MIVDLVRTTLSNWNTPWLLVFDSLDNLDEFPDITQFFPDSNCGRILITSRSASSKELGEVIQLDQLEKDEGLELLFHSSQADHNDAAVVEKILTRLNISHSRLIRFDHIFRNSD